VFKGAVIVEAMTYPPKLGLGSAIAGYRVREPGDNFGRESLFVAVTEAAYPPGHVYEVHLYSNACAALRHAYTCAVRAARDVWGGDPPRMSREHTEFRCLYNSYRAYLYATRRLPL
jgi:hypothetical protein